jgi:hypothetical protein
MTSLIGWVAVDSRGPTSIYLASDSRISWKPNGTWDYGRKVFASRNYPELLGYCGDVLFPTQVLGQVIDLIDGNLCISKDHTAEQKKDIIFKILKDSFRGYPINTAQAFSIVYCTRENEQMQSFFHLATLCWGSAGWSEEKLSIPAKSGIIQTLGSGSQFVKKWYQRWSNTKEKRTSRSVFSAFCDSIESGDDKYTGGAPQLVSIYRRGSAENVGIIYKEKRYLLGLPVECSEMCSAVDWRNGIFERCDWKTMKRMEKAQKHRRPKGLGNA